MASGKRRGKTAKPRKTPVDKVAVVQLKRVQKIRSYGVVLSVIVMLWLIFKPVPYWLAMPIAFVIPIVCFILLHRFGRTFDAEEDDDDDDDAKLPKEWYPIVMPTFGLAFNVYYDFQLASYGWSLLSAGLITIVVVAINAYLLKKRLEHTLEGVIVALIGAPVVFAYCWSALVFTNCYLDHSDPQIFPAEVLSKRIVEGESSDSFYINIDAGGPDEPPLKIKISEDSFDEIGKGDEVMVVVREGTLRFPWYYVARRE